MRRRLIVGSLAGLLVLLAGALVFRAFRSGEVTPSVVPSSVTARSGSLTLAQSTPAGAPQSEASAPAPTAAGTAQAAAAQPSAPLATIPAASTVASNPQPRNAASASPHIPAPSAWDRLEKPVVLATELRPQADGSLRRAQLVQVEGKYPLVVFEGTLPGADAGASNARIANATVKVADHVIVQPREGVSDADFRGAMEAAGLAVGERLGPDGPYLVKLPDATIVGVDDAVKKLQTSGAAAYAEPDFLVHASDIPAAKVLVDVSGGVAVYPEMALDANTIRPPQGPVFDEATQAATIEERLAALPGGARIITFDPPTFSGGPGSYRPYLTEQNFRISTADGAYVQNAYTASSANNGTNYLRSLSSETNMTVLHQEGLPFTMLSVDLSEYATTFPSPKSVTFVGYKVGGATVSQTFVTDGIIDGTGPLADFQTFTFNSTFTNLAKVVVSTNLFQIDNIAVLVEGQEAAPTPPPVPPLIYDVTWDAPKHTLDQLTEVSGPYAPSSINFGTPTVRDLIGTMAGPALEFLGLSGAYQQIRFGIGRNAQAYRLEFDAYVDLTSDFTLLFDSGAGVQALYLKSDGKITAFQSTVATPATVGKYPLRTKTSFVVAIDMVNAQWEILVNGATQYRGRFDSTVSDLQDIRFHTNASAGRAGLDNVRIYAYGADSGPTTGPRIYASPAMVTFPSTPVGGVETRFLGLFNSGTQTLNIQGVTSTDIQFSVIGSYPVNILPGGFFYVQVDARPQTVGAISARLNVASNDPQNPTLVVPVFGGGLGVPQVTLSPAALQVTMLANTLGTQTFKLGNSGSGSLSWNLVLKGGASESGVPVDPVRTPNDSLFPSLWAMNSSAVGCGGIDAVHAWSVTTGSSANVIALIDTGVDLTHPELQGNLWVNPGEIPGNGIDDDHNGYIDDVNGWDFYNRDNNPSDGNGHGTHVAGTIAARGDNTLGVVGVSWSAKIIPLKFLSDAGSGYTSDAIAAINYAKAVGARLSNNSWGGGGYSQALYDAIRAFGQAGSVFVAAAGNDGANNDAVPHYPSSYDLDNIVAVASTDSMDGLSYFSNFGPVSVDLAAPGSAILSLRPGGQFAMLSGTSMAAPHVTGAVALLLTQNPTLTPAQVKPLLLFGSDPLASLGNKVSSQGRLNAYRILKSVVPRWLQPTVTTGIVAPGGTVSIPLSVNTASLSPGTYMQTIAISSNDPNRRTLDLPVNLKVIPSTGYSQWLVDKFTSNQMLANATESTQWSDVADPDGDHLSNLLEFVTGGDPNVSDLGKAPRMVSSQGRNVFEIQIRESLAGASYRVEWSPSLTAPDWQTTGLVVVEDLTAGLPAGIHKLRLQVAGSPPAAFFRMVALKNTDAL